MPVLRGHLSRQVVRHQIEPVETGDEVSDSHTLRQFMSYQMIMRYLNYVRVPVLRGDLSRQVVRHQIEPVETG